MTLNQIEEAEVQGWMDRTTSWNVAAYLERVWLESLADLEIAAQVLRAAFGIPATDNDVAEYCQAMQDTHAIEADPLGWAREHQPEDEGHANPDEATAWALGKRDEYAEEADRYLTLIVGVA